MKWFHELSQAERDKISANAGRGVEAAFAPFIDAMRRLSSFDYDGQQVEFLPGELRFVGTGGDQPPTPSAPPATSA